MPYTVEYGTATGIAKSPTLSVARMPPSQISVLVVGGGPAGEYPVPWIRPASHHSSFFELFRFQVSDCMLLERSPALGSEILILL